VERNTKREPKD